MGFTSQRTFLQPDCMQAHLAAWSGYAFSYMAHIIQIYLMRLIHLFTSPMSDAVSFKCSTVSRLIPPRSWDAWARHAYIQNWLWPLFRYPCLLFWGLCSHPLNCASFLCRVKRLHSVHVNGREGSCAWFMAPIWQMLRFGCALYGNMSAYAFCLDYECLYTGGVHAIVNSAKRLLCSREQYAAVCIHGALFKLWSDSIFQQEAK